MAYRKLAGISIKSVGKKEVLEKIKNYIASDPRQAQEMLHIVSLNPEIIMQARELEDFKKIFETAQIQITDGAGVATAARLLKIPAGERVTGTDLMGHLLDLAGEMRSTVVLIGGTENVANEVAQCYQQKWPTARFMGISGIKNIKNPRPEEEKKIFSIVADLRPRFIFVSFGSPWQELWIERHKDQFKGAVIMGVGGAFDFISGRIPRAPRFLRVIGLEWLYRLVVQPWRWKRQLRLIQFIYLVGLQKIGYVTGSPPARG